MKAVKVIPHFTEKDKERFWAKVDKRGEDECWEWKAGKNRKGYGTFHVAVGDFTAHRASWFLKTGQQPRENLVLHHCDNPSCVNPDHLHLGDDLLNAQERCLRGRSRYSTGDDHYSRKHPEKLPRGVKHGNSKLSEESVLAIRALWRMGESQDSIAERFGICQRTVHVIVFRKTWTHI